MAAHLTDVDASVSASRNSPVEDDDVVFVESIQPPVCAPAVTEERNFVFASSKHENPQGNYSTIPPPVKDWTPQKGSISETIVIDDEEDTETDEGEEKNPTKFTEWGPPGNKDSTKNLDFFISSLSRSKTKTGVGPFNPGRMDVADTLHSGRFAAHYNPDSWISQSASFPRNQKQQGVDSLSPVASLPKQNFQPSNQILTKSVNIDCTNCKKPLQKGQTVYQRKGSAHLFCSTTCLSSFSHKRTQKTPNVTCKKDAPMKTATIIPPVESNESLPEFHNASLSPNEYYQNFRKEAFTKSRCIMCNKLGEVRHEISINSITHKLCSNNCFNEYRLTNGLIMNCCEQCSKYMPKNTGHKVLITGQQKRFCCQNCANEYKEIMETRSKILLLQNRKRNAIREENERKLLESSTLSEKIGEIPEKKGKSSEVIKVAADCSLDATQKEQDVNLPPVTAMPDTLQEQQGDRCSEDPDVSAVLSSDPGSWPRILNMKQLDILVRNDPPQIRNFNFPKDNTGRKFSEAYYTRILPSGEKTTRSWLLYSASKDSVFCLYCRLFGEGKNQLKNENGCKDWQHLSHILGKHEESEMHINNSVKYSKLKSNLNSKTNEADIERRFYEDGENGVLLLHT